MAYSPGDRVDGYLIEREIGRGGMGSVYLARHPLLPRYDAVKVMNPTLSADPRFRARFEREADLAASLFHRNIVAVLNRGTFNGQLWIAFQYVEGVDAATALRTAGGGGLDPARAAHIVVEISAALNVLHRRRLLHRDVKPANILLARGEDDDDPESVLLADFGIARPSDELQGLTETHAVLASLPYAAPEILDNKNIDSRVDIYALGCVLFELLTGSLPFPSNNPSGYIAGHLLKEPPQPSVTAGVPVGFDSVIATALAKDPADRYPDARQFAAAVRAALLTDPRPHTGPVPEPVVMPTVIIEPTTPRPPYVVELQRFYGGRTPDGRAPDDRVGPIPTASLPAVQRAELESLISRVAFFELPAVLPSNRVVPGEIFELISVTSGDRQWEVGYGRLGAPHPAELDEIVAILGSFAESAPPARHLTGGLAGGSPAGGAAGGGGQIGAVQTGGVQTGGVHTGGVHTGGVQSGGFPVAPVTQFPQHQPQPQYSSGPHPQPSQYHPESQQPTVFAPRPTLQQPTPQPPHQGPPYRSGPPTSIDSRRRVPWFKKPALIAAVVGILLVAGGGTVYLVNKDSTSGRAGTAAPVGSSTSSTTSSRTTAAAGSSAAGGAAAAGTTEAAGGADTGGPGDGGGGASVAVYAASGCEYLQSAYPEINGKTVSVYTSLVAPADQPEIDAYQAFEECTGVTVTYEASADAATSLRTLVDAGTAPDIAYIEPYQLGALVRETGAVVAPSSAAASYIPAFFGDEWIDYGSVDGNFYAVPISASVRSLVWYSPKVFAANGYSVPTTLDELYELSQAIADSGKKPWCAGFESGAASGWVGTDWVENAVLRGQGPDVYEKWWKHEIAFDDTTIASSMDAAGDYLRNDSFMNAGFGESASVATVSFIDAGLGIPTGDCFLHHQGDFYGASNFPEGTDISESGDAFAFYLPSADEYSKPIVVSGQMAIALRDAPEVMAFQEYLASSYADERAKASTGGWNSPNKMLNSSYLTAPLDIYCAQLIADPLAKTYYDASDLMPEAVIYAFWAAMLTWVQGQDTAEALATVEAAWPS